ncbi:hypothetical protein VH569_16865 [Azospirillum sp. 11R-A]|uniref:hypothetical protein n=1 Tax=Azospirillum sp. 11R-A TaxID=3111634 RepID=UPI003C1E8CBA
MAMNTDGRRISVTSPYPTSTGGGFHYRCRDTLKRCFFVPSRTMSDAVWNRPTTNATPKRHGRELLRHREQRQQQWRLDRQLPNLLIDPQHSLRYSEYAVSLLKSVMACRRIKPPASRRQRESDR